MHIQWINQPQPPWNGVNIVTRNNTGSVPYTYRPPPQSAIFYYAQQQHHVYPQPQQLQMTQQPMTPHQAAIKQEGARIDNAIQQQKASIIYHETATKASIFGIQQKLDPMCPAVNFRAKQLGNKPKYPGTHKI